MGERHESIVERVVHGIEDHIDRWRREDANRKREADADRDVLWAEAAERERMLKGAIEREAGGPPGKITDRVRVVYVVAPEEFADALEAFSPERERLIGVMPAPGHDGDAGPRGSWLIFEEVG